jgi:uncharacterized protein YcfL
MKTNIFDVSMVILLTIVMLITGCGVATPIPLPTPTPQLVSDSMVVRGEIITAKLFQTMPVDGTPQKSKWLWMVKITKVSPNETFSVLFLK